MTFKTVPRPFYIYFCALTLLGALSLGLSAAALQSLQSPTLSNGPPKTLLEERVQSAREIRRRLATPLAAPEPLQPITQRSAQAVGSRMVDQRSNQAQRSKPKLPRKALEAVAMNRDFSQSVVAHPVFDRHAIR